MLGPKGAGKSLHARAMADKLGLFHISFKDRLQELIIKKTKKKIGPEYEEEEEEPEESDVEEGQKDGIPAVSEPGDGKSFILLFTQLKVTCWHYWFISMLAGDNLVKL